MRCLMKLMLILAVLYFVRLVNSIDRNKQNCYYDEEFDISGKYKFHWVRDKPACGCCCVVRYGFMYMLLLFVVLGVRERVIAIIKFYDHCGKLREAFVIKA